MCFLWQRLIFHEKQNFKGVETRCGKILGQGWRRGNGKFSKKVMDGGIYEYFICEEMTGFWDEKLKAIWLFELKITLQKKKYKFLIIEKGEKAFQILESSEWL